MSVYAHRKKWRYEFWRDGICHRKGGFLTEDAAREAQAMARRNAKKMNTVFGILCVSRMDELKARSTDKWKEENQRLINNLIELWGKERKAITRIEVEKILNPLAKTAPCQANAKLKMMRSLFRHGLERNLWQDDPTKGIKKFATESEEKYIPSVEDFKKVLAVAKPIDRMYLTVLAHTMSRVTAINKLKWTDIHDNHLVLFTRKAKNSNLKRIIIPLNSIMRKTLPLIPKVGPYVFMNKRTGKPYVYRRRMLHTLCDKAKVEHFTYHCIRHFTASLMDNMGVPLTTIQKLLGHERSTTTDCYLQSLRGSSEEAMELLKSLGVPPKTTPQKKGQNA